MLDRWAADNHFQIVSREWRWVRLGPFAAAFFGHQSVYRLVVQDQSGALRSCWAKLGGFFRGLMVDDVEIAWEADPFVASQGARP
jgi:hypothetical protein